MYKERGEKERKTGLIIAVGEEGNFRMKRGKKRGSNDGKRTEEREREKRGREREREKRSDKKSSCVEEKSYLNFFRMRINFPQSSLLSSFPFPLSIFFFS
jgi:hypothetical protein